MNTLRKAANALTELTDSEAKVAHTWAEENQTAHPLAKAYIDGLAALGCVLEIDPKSLSPHMKVNKGASRGLKAGYLVDAVLNPLFELRRVLGHAVLEEMKS